MENIIISKPIGIREAAEYIGSTPATMYRYAKTGKIASYKTARKIYFQIEDLDAYLYNPDNYRPVKTAE
jgi:excisionase family DNA binding protein